MNKIRVIIDMLKKLHVIIPHEYLKKIPSLFITMIVSSVLELLGIAVIMPFISTLTDSDSLMRKWYAILLMKIFGVRDFYGLLLIMSLSVVFIYVAKNVVLLLARHYQNKFQCGIQSAMSTEMLQHCTERPYSYFLSVNSSEVLTGIFQDVNNVYTIIGAFLATSSESFTVLMIGILIFMTDPVMALGVLILTAVCVFIIVFGFKRITIKSGIQYRVSYNQMYQNAMQTIGGIKEIDVAKRGNFFLKEFDKNRKKFRDAQIIGNFLNLCPERIVETMFVCGIIMVLTFRIRWGMDASSSIVTLSAFAVAGYRLLPSVNKISSNLNSLIYYQPSLDASYANIMGAREAEREQREYKKRNSTHEVAVKEKRFEDKIEVRQVDFAYEGSKESVLENLNLIISKGEAIAFIGESGAGKSTLSDILLGLLMPQKGSIYMDGVDIYTIPDKWSNIVGYVPQSVYLLDATIKENIIFGMETEPDTDERVWKVLENAQLSNFVRSLPESLDTMVGERGVRLSGGQRQRIAIARALYNNPDVLILDEATSALDNDTEKAVMSAIDALHGSKTLIIVAHRLSTIAGCDKIYEIKGGKALLCGKEDVLKRAWIK